MTRQPQRVPTDSAGWRYSLVALVALAVGLRLWNLRKQPFWVDEFDELLISSQGLGSITTHPDGFPPLGFLITRGWLEFGSFESARYLALAYGVAAVALIGLATLRIGGKRAAQFAVAIAAISPFLIWYAQELRTYSLLMMLAAASLLSLVRAYESGRRADWMVYGVVNGLGLWSHYFFALTIAVGMLWLWMRRRELQGLRSAVLAHLATAAIALPLLGLIAGDLDLQVDLQAGTATADASTFGIGPLGYTFFTFFSGFSLGPSLRELHDSSLSEALAGGWPWIIVFASLVVPLGVWSLRRLQDRWVQLLTSLVVVPVLLAGFLSIVADVGFRPRYVSWCVVPLIVLAALAASRVSMRAATVALAVLVFASGWAYANRHWSERYGNEDMRGATAVANEIDPSGEQPVLVMVDYMAPLADYYAGSHRVVVGVSNVSGDGEGLAEAKAGTARAAADGPFIFIYTREFHGDVNGLFLAALQSDGGLNLEADLAGARVYATAGRE